MQAGPQLNEQPRKAKPFFAFCCLIFFFLIEENAHEAISLGMALWELSGTAEHHLPENTVLLIREMRDKTGLHGPQPLSPRCLQEAGGGATSGEEHPPALDYSFAR